MALTGMMIASALALAKNQLIDQPAAARKRKLAAASAAYSPWNKAAEAIASQPVDDPNAIGAVMGGAGFGAAIGSQIADSRAKSNLLNAGAGALNASSGSTDPSVNSLGAMDMSAKLGEQANNFSTTAPSAWSEVDKKPQDPYWSFGHGLGDKFSQPVSGGQVAEDPNDPAVKYKSILDRGLSPKNPEDSWQINPFKLNY